MSQISGGHALPAEGGANALNEVGNHADLRSISQYALQAQNTYRNVLSRCYSRRMERTPDERREILRRFISDNQLKIAPWAKAAAVDKNSIYNFLNGHSQSLDHTTYAKLARASRIPVWKLNGDAPEAPSPSAIWVVGQVQAGHFLEAVEWDRSHWYSIDVPVAPRFRANAKALLVAGESMNKEFRDGAIVIWVDMLDFRPPEHEDFVVAYAYSNDGRIEATVKEYRLDDEGRAWLWPKSTEPEFQSPVCLASLPADLDHVEIKGIVVGDYRPRVN